MRPPEPPTADPQRRHQARRRSWPPGFNTFVAAGEFIASLNALASEDRVYVLSSPSIMTSENKKVVITGNSITQTVEYKDAGIILSVTPASESRARWPSTSTCGPSPR